MSGHSKWHSIKHQKAVTDARRGQLFTKLTREIIVAVRNGGPNPDTNISLRLAVQKARDASMPSDNIERAIKRASGATEGVNLVEIVLEGYGPGGGAILVEALSDNRNRTIQAVRNVFSRGGGSLGEAGCVAWQFDPKGVVTVRSEEMDTEELALQAIDAGAEDVTVEASVVEVYTRPEELEKVRAALEQENIPVASAELSMVPKAALELGEKAAVQTLRLMEKLDELDDVRHVSSNVDFSDEVLAKYQE
ncbi:MAG: YebC/PmpR family DNA-binding transcriptional regulator [Dehalococcoidales bacterium]|nr:MAG: YebC/PmpR family DNA-binding transcriptional regulator [Dehalococcoidales bacterium]